MQQRLFGMVMLAACLVLFSCASQNKLEKMQQDCEARISQALKRYEKGRYSSVQLALEDARTQCSGSPVMDTVLFYLGMSNLQMKNYIEARTEFQRLVQDFPGSPFFDEAKFRIAYTVLKQSSRYDRDQKETNEALSLFDRLIEMYPNSAFIDSAIFYRKEAYEKLAFKEFKNAQFYEKVNEYESAVVYYRSFMSEYPDSKLYDQAQYNSIVLLKKLDRIQEAKELLSEFLEKGKDKKLKKEAKELFSKSEADTKPKK